MCKNFVRYSNIILFQGPNCPTDRLSISQTGNADLTDAHNYCGYGQLTLMSFQNRLSVGKQSINYAEELLIK